MMLLITRSLLSGKELAEEKNLIINGIIPVFSIVFTGTGNKIMIYLAAQQPIVKLSMGGHGAMWLGIRHKDVFGAAGSTSGGVDIRPFPKNWSMNKQLGELASNKRIWDEHTVVNQLDKIQNGDLALIIDCGEDDFFLNVNKDFHDRLCPPMLRPVMARPFRSVIVL